MQLLPEDYYFEKEKIVFTEKYLLKRGFCCQNKCRHCPYISNNSNLNMLEKNNEFRRTKKDQSSCFDERID